MLRTLRFGLTHCKCSRLGKGFLLKFQAGLRIRIHFIRIRIRHFRLNINTDPDPDPIWIWIQSRSKALMTKDWKKITAEKKN
jgi:hypothetical protein